MIEFIAQALITLYSQEIYVHVSPKSHVGQEYLFLMARCNIETLIVPICPIFTSPLMSYGLDMKRLTVAFIKNNAVGDVFNNK